MTVSPEIEAQIQRAHFVDHWPVGTIATQLGVHHDVVRRVLGIEARNAEAKKWARTSPKPIPFFGKRRLDEITAKDVEAFKGEKRASGLGPKTVNNMLTILRKLLATAIDWELIEK